MKRKVNDELKKKYWGDTGKAMARVYPGSKGLQATINAVTREAKERRNDSRNA